MATTNRVHIFGYAGTFVLGGVCGAILVFVFWTRPSLEMVLSAIDAKEAQDAYVAYRYGDYSIAREALLKFIDLRKASDLSNSELSASLDIALSYARLAVLSEKAGKDTNSEEFWRQAVQFKSNAGKTASKQEMRETVQHLDSSWDKRLNSES